MALSPRRIASLVTLFVLAGCSVETSDDRTPPSGGTTFLPDAGTGTGTSAPVDAGAPAPSARELELLRMQAHLDALYAQSDVVHRFTTAGGDAVDCVPFVKQPGFSLVGSTDGVPPVLDSPLRPSSASASLAGFGDGLDANGAVRACPDGAVPIRRYVLADLARFATLEDFLRKEPLHVLDASGLPVPLGPAGSLHAHAGYSTSLPNWGAQATFNLWNPAVERESFSLSQLWVIGGTGAQEQTIEAGYTFDRFRSSGEDASRLFLFSTRDGYGKDSCYDLTCKAFVQLANTHILLGGRFDKASVMGGEQREFTLRAQFCPASQCKDWAGWWLQYEAGAFSEWIGFYPRKLFLGRALQDGAGRVDFGGEVASSARNAAPKTDMGSGLAPDVGFGRAAYQRDLRTITVANSWAAFDVGHVTLENESPCYTQGGLVGVSGRIQGSTAFFFGGKGGCR